MSSIEMGNLMELTIEIGNRFVSNAYSFLLHVTTVSRWPVLAATPTKRTFYLYYEKTICMRTRNEKKTTHKHIKSMIHRSQSNWFRFCMIYEIQVNKVWNFRIMLFWLGNGLTLDQKRERKKKAPTSKLVMKCLFADPLNESE